MPRVGYPTSFQNEFASVRGYGAVAEWRAGAANPALPNVARIAQNISDIERTIQGYTQGRTLNNTVDYTANLYTSYSFREGVLRGLSAGAGANFRGKTLIGNVNQQPFNYLYADAFKIVSAHLSYPYRFGGVRARFQVNVNNLLDEDGLIFTSYSFNSALARDFRNNYRYQTPRRFAFTATFDF